MNIAAVSNLLPESCFAWGVVERLGSGREMYLCGQLQGGNPALSRCNRIISICLVGAETVSVSDNTWHSVDTRTTIFHCCFDPWITSFTDKSLIAAHFIFNVTGILPHWLFCCIFVSRRKL